jgi:precorrin-2/cobalt-factor-2 C20-methyltransferase
VTRLGVLYGVGAGPGATDLLTLRAVSVLRSADVLALPRSSDFGESVAWQIVRDHCGNSSGQIRLRLTFPMSKDTATVAPRVARAVDAIGAHLTEGLSVAFVTEGDPSLYSTFGYVRDEARRRWPSLDVQVVPGVTSITSVAMVGGVALADGQERIAVVPATYGVDDLVELFTRFDTVVLMKLGAELPAIITALERTGLTDHAFFVSKATMKEERLVRDVQTLGDERGGCFAMMIVKRGDRSGVLVGRSAVREARR